MYATSIVYTNKYNFQTDFCTLAESTQTEFQIKHVNITSNIIRSYFKLHKTTLDFTTRIKRPNLALRKSTAVNFQSNYLLLLVNIVTGVILSIQF